MQNVVLPFFLSVCCLGLLVPIIPIAQAHNPDQPPFVRINDTETDYYPVGSTSLGDIPLPQDSGRTNYLVGESLKFEVISENLPYPSELLTNFQIGWDFGDGGSSNQFTATHTYTKMGSYVVRLTGANPSQGVKTELLDLIQVNIVPHPDYQLPNAVITANGRQSKNTYSDILQFDFKEPIQFETTGTAAGSSEIIEYFWDFGDQQRGSGSKISHTYSTQWSYVSVMLRLKTKDGFQVDTMLQLENPNPIVPSEAVATTSKSASWWKYLAGGLGILLLIGIIRRYAHRKIS